MRRRQQVVAHLGIVHDRSVCVRQLHAANLQPAGAPTKHRADWVRPTSLTLSREPRAVWLDLAVA
jgi:hypothetical protein